VPEGVNNSKMDFFNTFNFNVFLISRQIIAGFNKYFGAENLLRSMFDRIIFS